MTNTTKKPLVGVLSIQGAFEEHQACLEASGCRTKQVSSATHSSVTRILLVGRLISRWWRCRCRSPVYAYNNHIMMD